LQRLAGRIGHFTGAYYRLFAQAYTMDLLIVHHARAMVHHGQHP
jgi:hypothetical protein